MARDRAQSRQHQLDIKVKPTGQHFMAAIALTDSAMAIAASYAAKVFGVKTPCSVVSYYPDCSDGFPGNIKGDQQPVFNTGRDLAEVGKIEFGV